MILQSRIYHQTVRNIRSGPSKDTLRSNTFEHKPCSFVLIDDTSFTEETELYVKSIQIVTDQHWVLRGIRYYSFGRVEDFEASYDTDAKTGWYVGHTVAT